MLKEELETNATVRKSERIHSFTPTPAPKKGKRKSFGPIGQQNPSIPWPEMVVVPIKLTAVRLNSWAIFDMAIRTNSKTNIR